MKKINLLVITIFTSILTFGQAFFWKSVNLQGMGYVTGIIAHPTSGDIYARTDVYGIYKWDAFNSKWAPLCDGKISKANIETFAVNPSNPNTLYIVGGNNESGSLYKSIDQGSTWNELPNFFSKTLITKGNGIWRGAGERLAVDPNNGGNVLFFGSRATGLWKSIDAGTNWSQIPTASIPVGSAGGVIFVTFVPSSGNATTNSQKIYVGVQGKGVYATINGGITWTLLSGGPAITANPVRSSITNAGVLYVTYASSDGGSATGYVYKYTGSGSLSNVTPSGKSAEGFWGIAVDPANANNVATYQWNPSNGNGIHYSTNGGTSWTSKAFNHVDPSWYPTWSGWTYSAGMIMDPANPTEVWLTTGFAVYNTPDISTVSPVWTAKMSNLEELVVNNVKCPPVVGGADLLTGFADKQGVRVANKDIVPTQPFEPDGFGITTGIAYCESDPNFIVSVGGDQNNGADWESLNQKYRKSINNGVTWTNFTRPTATSVNGNIAVSATDKNRWVIAPKDRVTTFNDPLYTTDGGNSWVTTTGTPTNKENGCTEQWSGSEFLVADKVNGMTFYYYCDKNTSGTSGFYTSTDGGATFVQKYTGLPSWYKSQIASVPGKEGHVFYTNKNGSSLYLTTNGGTSWNVVSTVTSCKSIGFGKAIAPSVEPTLYINGTIGGIASIYKSTDYGLTWENINDGNLPVNNVGSVGGDMRTAGLVYLTTGGRGVFYGISNSSTVAVTSVSVSPTTATINLGATQQLTATVLPANASNKNVTWSSSNNAIATVSSTGLVTAVAAGSANITVTTVDGAKSAISTITVTNPNVIVTSVSVSPTSAAINIGATQQLTATVLPANATNNNVTWSSSDNAIATVNTTGLVTAVASGSANITVTTDDGAKTAISVITVNQSIAQCAPYEAEINPTLSGVLLANNQVGYTGYWFLDYGGQNTYAQWSINVLTSGSYSLKVRYGAQTSRPCNLLVNSVSAGSMAFASTGSWTNWLFQTAQINLNAGNNTIRITANSSAGGPNIDNFEICNTQVLPVTSVSVSPTTATINLGATQQLTATVLPANASNKNVTWSSSNNAIATVSSTGLVTAVAAGSANITVTTVDGAKSAISTITVTNPNVIVTSVSLSPTSAAINIGATQQLTATVLPANATNNNVTWSSSDNAIATVNTTGLVTAVASGSANITVTTDDGAKTAISVITVNQSIAQCTPYEAEINPTLSGVLLANNQVGYTGYWFLDYGGQNTYAQWSINVLTSGSYSLKVRYGAQTSRPCNLLVNSVSAGSMAFASTGSWTNWLFQTAQINLNAGNNTIRITASSSAGGPNIDNFEICNTQVIPVTSVSVSPTTATINLGATQQLTATVLPANASNKNVTWSSSNNAIATVSSTGLVTAVAAGSANITVTTVDGAKSAISTITVTNPNVIVTSVSVSPTSAAINIGATQQLTATVLPANATNNNVTWSSSDNAIATVNTTGLVTAVASGSANITVTTDDGAKTAISVITVNQSIAQCAPYEAEINPTLSGVVLANNQVGYTGYWFLDYGGQNTYAQWSINVVTSGSYSLKVRYGAQTSRPCNLLVNSVSAGSMAFASTGSWTNWLFQTAQINLNAGNNTIRITASSSAGGPNIDNFEICYTTVLLKSPVVNNTNISTLENPTSDLFSIYPNPAKSYFSLNFNTKNNKSQANILVTDLTGKRIWNCVVNDTKDYMKNTSEFAKGIYIINVSLNGKKQVKRLIIQ